MKRTSTGGPKAKRQALAMKLGYKNPKATRGPKVPRGANYGVEGPELKTIDTVVANSRITFNSAVSVSNLLNVTAQGVGAQQRLGRKFRMKSLFIRWNGDLAPTTTGSASLRMLVVYDKEPEGAAPPIASVLVADNIGSVMNLDNQARFSVLCDEVIQCVGTQGPQSWNVKRYIKLNHQTVTSDTNNNSIVDIQTGSIYAFFWQSGQLLIASPTGNFYSRVRFVDE